MRLPAFRCIFLDLGRTLVDLDFGALADRMKELTGFEAERLQKVITTEDLASRFETGAIGEEVFYSVVCRRLDREIGREEFFDAWNSIFRPEPIIADHVLASLAERAPLWALSNTNSAHHRFLAERYAFFRYFTGQVLSFEVGLQKPDERIFRRALEMASVGAAEAVFVDDQAANVESARNLGIDAFRFFAPDQFIREMRSRGLLSNDE